MNPLPIDRPLAGLFELSGLSQRSLAMRREPFVSQAAVGDSLRLGDRIKLSSLAAYARAAGYILYVRITRGAVFGGESAIELTTAAPGDLDVTVAGARALLEALGLEMTLAVEPAEKTKR